MTRQNASEVVNHSIGRNDITIYACKSAGAVISGILKSFTESRREKCSLKVAIANR